MKSQHNRKGSLSPEEIELREKCVEEVTNRHLQRKKLASLCNLLRPTPSHRLMKVRPEICDKDLKTKTRDHKVHNAV